MTRPEANHAQEAGFTLVEVLVSMFIFSLITIGALIALSTTLDARDRAETRLSEIEQLAAARRLMADDFATMTLRQNRDGLGGFVDPSQAAIQTDGIILTRRARPNPDGAFARGDLLRIEWRVERGQLIRSFLPHENPAYVEPAIDRVVLEGVDAMDIAPLFSEGMQAADIRARLAPGVLLTSDTLFLAAPALSITLTHSDGTTTRHIFEQSGA